MQCHICGKFYHGLFRHVEKTHGMTVDEYREEFGLNRGQALVSTILSQKLADIHRGHLLKYAGKHPQTAETLRHNWGEKLREQGRHSLRERAKETILRPDVKERAQIAAKSPEAMAKLTFEHLKSEGRRKELADQIKDGTHPFCSQESRDKSAASHRTPEYREKVSKPRKPTTRCSIDGCDNPAVSRTMCKQHYAKWWHSMHPDYRGKPNKENA